MQYKAVIFDLDGTLINSLEDLADSVNEALVSRGYPQHHVNDYRMMVGNGARMLIKRALPINSADAIIDEVLAEYKKIYEKKFLCKTRPYPGILSMLEELKQRNVKIAVCSNKHNEAVGSMIDALFPAATFQYAWGEQAGLPRKPAPDAVLKLAELMQVKPAETVYVGDSAVDMQTGLKAGMLTVGVLWGFRGRQELKDNGANVLLTEPKEFCEKISLI